MIARRNRQFVSPVSQDRVTDVDDSPLLLTSAQFRSSRFSFKFAPRASSSLENSHLGPRVACFVEVPLAKMAFSRQGAGTKRKRVSANGSGTRGRRTHRITTARGGDVGNSTTSTSGLSRGIAPLALRKPASSASHNSDWSSLASTSPPVSRNASFPDGQDELSSSWHDSDKASGRGSSRFSLRRGMRCMTLEDLPSPTEHDQSATGHMQQQRQREAGRTRGRSRSVTRLAAAGRAEGHASRDGSRHNPEASSISSDQESDDSEDDRLLNTAPNWQLSRLRKDELVRLNRLAGSWNDEVDVDVDMFTKQELVNGIIVCRSRLNKSKSPFRGERDGHGRRTTRAPSRTSSGGSRPTSATPDPQNPEQPLCRSRSRSRRTTRNARPDDIDEASGRREGVSESDASHEGGGEETEAEPARTANRRRTLRRLQGGNLRRMDSSLFEEAGSMPYGNDDHDDLPPYNQPQHQKQQQQQAVPTAHPRRQLRARSTIAANRASRRGRDRAIFGGSDATNASSSSLAFTSSSISPLGNHVLRMRGSRRNVYTASSPVRIASRAHHGGLSVRRRPMTRAAAAALHDVLTDASSSRTPRPVRQTARANKGVSFWKGAGGTDDAAGSRRRANQGADPMDEDWEGASSHSSDEPKSRAETQTRMTRAMARQTDQQHELSADDADCELVSQLSVVEDDSDDGAQPRRHNLRRDAGASIEDATPGKSTRKPGPPARREFRGRQRSATLQGGGRRRMTTDAESLASGQGRDEDEDRNGGDDVDVNREEDDSGSDASSTEADSPLKFRKLRNGKLRMPIERQSRRHSAQLADGSRESPIDVDMETADEGLARRPNAADEGACRSSPALEEAMFEPTAGSLSRLRRAQLIDLCRDRDLETHETDRKVDLIDRLLDWYSRTRSPPTTAASTDGPMDTAELDAADESDSSASTAKQPSDADVPTPRTARAGRAPAKVRAAKMAGNAAAAGAPLTGSSEVPLLLRAKANKIESNKLPTPPLTSHNDEANAAAPGDGVDELNGLDLESLGLLDKEIPPNKLEKLEKIGSGGFKDVYVGRYRISKTRVSRVAIADIRDQLTEMDIKELSLLRDLKHENIVRFIGVSIPPDGGKTSVPCMIVSELCVNGDLFDYIRNTSAPSDAEVFRILLEMARGLEYLHTRTPAIIHRDVKSTNVLITRNGTAKINDFGLAKVKNTQRSMMRSLVGTVNWQAAELWTPKPHYNEKVDVWSAAMTFWEVLQWHQPEKKYPFQGMNEHQIYQDVGARRIRPYTGAVRRQFGGEIVELLDRMWDHQPKQRPSMTEVCREMEALVAMKKAQTAKK
ncbi:hypothetical protein ACQY0O_001814 [Thecaphora frezii]